jgi:hypothetical protein
MENMNLDVSLLCLWCGLFYQGDIGQFYDSPKETTCPRCSVLRKAIRFALLEVSEGRVNHLLDEAEDEIMKAAVSAFLTWDK